MKSRIALSFLLFCLLVFPIAAQTEKPATSSITGRITHKNEPLPGVLVTIELVRRNPSAQSSTVSAKTDNDGRYRLTGLAAGQYSVSPRALAYAIPYDGATYRPGKVVTVNDHEAVENVDFALVKGGVLTGTITDHTGRPIIGQQVRLTRITEQNQNTAFRTGNYRMYSTDDRGAYRLFGLPAGRYKIGLGEGGSDGSLNIGRAGGYYRLTFYPGVTNEAEAKIIELSEGGEVTDIDFKVSAPEKTYEAKGRVIDGNSNAPLVGLNVAYGPINKESGGLNGYGWTNDLTNANGEFVLRGLTPGRYGTFPAATAANDFYSDTTTFEVTNSDVEGVEIKAFRGAAMNGTVIVEGTTDPAVLKLVYQLFVNTLMETKAPNTPGSSAPVNPDGSFRVLRLRPGKVRLTTYMNGASGLMQKRVERDGVPVPDGFDISGTEQINGVRIVMVYSSGVIRGQINVVGTLPPDARLVVRASQGDQSRSATVDARGRFVMESLAPGEYALSISQSYVSGASVIHTRPTPMQKVTVGAGETNVTLTYDAKAKEQQ